MVMGGGGGGGGGSGASSLGARFTDPEYASIVATSADAAAAHLLHHPGAAVLVGSWQTILSSHRIPSLS